MGNPRGVRPISTFLKEPLQIRQERARAKQIRNLQFLFAQFATSGKLTEEFTAVAAAHPHEFLAVAGESIDVLKGSQRERLQDLCLQHHPLLLKQVTDPNPNRAIRAISLLGKLDSPETRDAFQEALYHPVQRVRMEVRQAILRGTDWWAQCAVLAETRSLEPWERASLYHSLPENPELLAAFLSTAFGTGRPDTVLAALDLVLSQRAVFAVDDTSGLFDLDDKDVRVKLFEALPYLATDRDLIPVLASGLDDPDRRVRSAAVRACAQFPSDELCERLLAVVRESTDFEEVLYAVLALRAAGGKPFEQLQGEALAGCDMASRAVAEVLEQDLLSRAPVSL